MADETNETLSNGEDHLPTVGVISQYVKDLSFENPNAPEVFQWQGQPQIDVNFNIGNERVAEEAFEVSIKVNVVAKTEEKTAFQVELVYAGLFGIRNVPEDQMAPILLAQAPAMLFPFARRILADAVRDGGFPPLMLDPIDFGALFMQQAELAAQHAGIEGNA